MRKPGEPFLQQARAAIEKSGEPDREELGKAIVLLERAIQAGLSSGGEAQAQFYIGLVLLRLDPASAENRIQASAAFERALSLRRWGAKVKDEHLRLIVKLLDPDYVLEARRLRAAGQARAAADFLRGKYVLAPDLLAGSAQELAALCQEIGDEAEATWCREQLVQARFFEEGPSEPWMRGVPPSVAAPSPAHPLPDAGTGRPAAAAGAPPVEVPPTWSWGEEPLAPEIMDELQTDLLALAEPTGLAVPGGPGELFNRALQAHRAGDLATAARIYEEALAASPSDVAARANLGALLLQQDRPDEAERHLSRAARRVEGTPAELPIQVNVGLAAYRLGDVEAARRAWLRGLELAPREEALRRALAALLALVAEHWRGRFRQAGGSAPESDGSAWRAVMEKAAEYAGEAGRLAPESSAAPLVGALAAAGLRDVLAATPAPPGDEARRALESGLAAAGHWLAAPGAAGSPARLAEVRLIRGSLAALLAVWKEEAARTELAGAAAAWLAEAVESGAGGRGRAIARYFADRLGGMAADTIRSSLGRPEAPLS